MNSFTFDELTVGQVASFKDTIDKSKMQKFAEISGDINPLHTEQDIIYGMLTTSFLSTLAGMYLPGEKALIHSVDISFPNPHKIDSNIEVTGSIIEKNDTFKFITLKVAITSNGTKVLRGKMKVGIRE